MNKRFTCIGIAARIWIFSALTFTTGAFIYFFIYIHNEVFVLTASFLIASVIGSIPAFIVLCVSVYLIQQMNRQVNKKIQLLFLANLFITFLYGIAASFLINLFKLRDEGWKYFLETFFVVTGILYACTCSACLLNINAIKIYFGKTSKQIQSSFTHQKKINMENNESLVHAVAAEAPSENNKTLIKGIITGLLILAMLIPTLYIESLVTERQGRREEIVKEVSSKWAGAQTVTGPYLVIPYTEAQTDADNKKVFVRKNIILLPEQLNVSGTIIPEERSRSIYQVLLYRSGLNVKGSFHPSIITKDIDINALILSDARICMGISDFKGIEDKVTINLNNEVYDMQPGIPVKAIDKIGLFAVVPLTADSLNKNLSFNFNISLRGSEQLHFVPLSANSKFNLQSSWPNPSFDGNTLPNDRTVTKDGFDARWQFNQANLPYTTIIKDEDVDINKLSFGVTMVQPADQYAKTLRSAKYAILFIGLTFALFFIIELLQNKPVHPVQYILVGIALTVFYTLLLSISEIISFDYAYLIAATATVLLITLYVKNHFRKWKIAGIFTGVLSGLYSFIFILISLEDTALLVGSIALFIVLALIMYASRNVNWYNPSAKKDLSNAV